MSLTVWLYRFIMGARVRPLPARPGAGTKSRLFNVCETMILYYNVLISMHDPRSSRKLFGDAGAGLVCFCLSMRTLGFILLMAAAVPSFAQDAAQKAFTDSEVRERVTRLKDTDTGRKLGAIADLGRAHGSVRARNALISELKREKNPHIRARIVDALGEKPDKAAADELVKIARTDKDADARVAAVRSMAFAGEAYVPLLIEKFNDEGEELGIRLRAADSLTRYPTDKVFAALAAGLDNAAGAIRTQVVVSLYNGFGSDKARVRPYLQRMTADPEAGATAKIYIERLGE